MIEIAELGDDELDLLMEAVRGMRGPDHVLDVDGEKVEVYQMEGYTVLKEDPGCGPNMDPVILVGNPEVYKIAGWWREATKRAHDDMVRQLRDAMGGGRSDN